MERKAVNLITAVVAGAALVGVGALNGASSNVYHDLSRNTFRTVSLPASGHFESGTPNEAPSQEIDDDSAVESPLQIEDSSVPTPTADPDVYHDL